MNFFAGMTAGFGEAQGKYNTRMMDFLNQKSQTMSQLYGHLADTIIQSGGNQDIASEFVNRAKGWASANPLMDPKGYKQLVQNEKNGLHSVVDQASQKSISDYHNQQFNGNGGNTSAPTSPSVGYGASPAPAQTQTPPSGQASPYQIPIINDMLGQLTGGQPLTGSLGVPTPLGHMAMSVVPDVIKQRMEMQQKMGLIHSMFGQQSSSNGGLDPRSPQGSASQAALMREMGFNAPVTQWRPIGRALYQDEKGSYQLGPAMASWRDGSTWIRTAPGQEKEVSLVDENPKVTQAKDGSLWAETTRGPIRVGNGSMPIQVGSSDSTQPTPGGGTAKSTRKIFTSGSGHTATPSPAIAPLVPTGEPTVGTILPPGLNPGATQGPPSSRTSTASPSQAYKPQGGFSLEKLETSSDPVDKQIAAYITHPESFDASTVRREMWNSEFAQRTGGAITQSPVPLREFRTDFMKQRNAIVSGFNASKNISNILTSTDGQLVGIIAGRWMEAMNKLGSAKGMKFLEDNQDANPASVKSILPQLSQDRPELAHKLMGNDSDLLAQKAADLITTMRLYNFADVKNTIGGVQGVSRVYQFLKDSLMNPGMDMPLILGHLNSLNRNMADGLLVLEQARWGQKIPYIREKELMSNLYWDPHVEQLISKYQAAASGKGTQLSRQDALFLLWRNGKLEADPGNSVDVQRVPGKE